MWNCKDTFQPSRLAFEVEACRKSHGFRGQAAHRVGDSIEYIPLAGIAATSHSAIDGGVEGSTSDSATRRLGIWKFKRSQQVYG